MSAGALGLLGSYGVLIFGAGWLGRRRRHQRSPIRFRSLRGTPRAVALGITAGFVLLVAGPVGGLIHRGPELPALDRLAVHMTGVAIFMVGLAVVAAAQRAMGPSWRVGLDPDERTDLVTGGPFRKVRNPIYTALVAMATGVALMVTNVISVVAVLVLAVAIVLQVRLVEEPYLSRIHGQLYDQYRARTARFLPPLVGRNASPMRGAVG